MAPTNNVPMNKSRMHQEPVYNKYHTTIALHFIFSHRDGISPIRNSYFPPNGFSFIVKYTFRHLLIPYPFYPNSEDR